MGRSLYKEQIKSTLSRLKGYLSQYGTPAGQEEESRDRAECGRTARVLRVATVMIPARSMIPFSCGLPFLTEKEISKGNLASWQDLTQLSHVPSM